LIKDYWICNLVEVIIEGLKVGIIEKIKIAKSKDKEIIRIVEKVKKARVKILQGEEWQIDRELVLKERKMYVSKDKALRVEII